jgi:hypothetical protein
MKKYTIEVLCLLLILNACDQKDQYDYCVDLTKDELISLKDYMKKYNDLKNKIYIRKNFVYSNDEEMLRVLKSRTNVINTYYSGILINYNENYYFINKEELIKVNWMNNDEIFKNIPNSDVSLLERDIPEYILNLSRDEFINNYLEKKENYSERKENYYRSKINRGLFYDEKTILYENIIFLSQIKHGFILLHNEWSGTYIIDPIIKINQ